MATRSQKQVYADLVAAGASPDTATILTAIAGAESGYRDDAVGDANLTDNTWGPSFGLFQVRTLKKATGNGSDRDISFLSASDANQAKAALDISGQGRDFTPWTTFTNGAYQGFLPQGSVSAGTAQLAAATGSSTSLRDLVPLILYTGLGLLLALALIAGGAVILARPPLQRAAGKAAQLAAVIK